MRIRVIKTGSRKQAIQVVSKRNGKVTIHKHIGSYGNSEEKILLEQKAKKYIKEQTGQISFNDWLKYENPTEIEITDSKPLFVYDLLKRIYDKLGFNCCVDDVIRDIIISRVYKPASKKETQEILLVDFGRNYSLKTIYRHLKKCISCH